MSEPAGARVRLIREAGTLFADRGFRAAATREIARRAGCDKKLISDFFGGKQGLYDAVVTRFFGTMGRMNVEDRFWKQSAAEGWRSVVDFWHEFAAAERAAVKLILREMVEQGRNLDARFNQVIAMSYVVGEKRLRRLQERGELAPIDLRNLFVSFAGMLFLFPAAAETLETVFGLDAASRAAMERRSRAVFDLFAFGASPSPRAEIASVGSVPPPNRSDAGADDARTAPPCDETRSNKRKELRAAAEALFAEKGYDGATGWDIADRARADKALINYHFGGKRKLYLDILRTFLDDLRRRLAGPPPDADAAVWIAEAATDALAARPAAATILLREAMGGGAGLREVLGGSGPELFAAAVRRVEALREEGRLRAADAPHFVLSVAGAALLYVAAKDFYGALWGADLLSPDAVARRRAAFARFLAFGIELRA